MMDSDQFVAVSGPVDARYLAFLETISTLRPSLHRYCARMTGSVMDGEDVAQEALIEAYRKLDQSGPFCSSRRPVRGPSQTLRLPARELSRLRPVIQR
jgi:hypothetical protein